MTLPPDWLAARKLRTKASGNFISNSTASWMWRVCLKKEWSLRSCLSRYVLRLMLQVSEGSFKSVLWAVLMLSSAPSGPRESDARPLPGP